MEQDNAGKKKNNHEMTTVTLINVLQFLKAPIEIDYFSLDVEGGEWDV
jgi:hypothetical protein